MNVTERILVTAAENMSDEHFVMHMEKRHADSLAYVVGLRMILGDEMLLRMWRLYHEHLHRWRIDLEHEHGAP